MKKLILLLAAPALVLSLTAGGAGLAGASQPDMSASRAEPAGNHSAVVLGDLTFSEVEDRGSPKRVSNRFTVGTTQIYAFFDYKSVHEHDTLTGTWYRGGQPLLRQTHTLTDIFGQNPPTDGTVWFIARIQSGFTPGYYRLEVSMNDRVTKLGTFSVEPADQKPAITDVAFTAAVQAEASAFRYPIITSAFYPAATSRVYAVFDHFNMKPGTLWAWKLRREGLVLTESARLKWVGKPSGSFALPLTLPRQAGLYDLDLFVDNEWAGSQSLAVGNPAPPPNRLIQTDDFESAASGWTEMQDDGGEMRYKDGRYTIRLASLEPYWGTSERRLGDFVAEVDAAPMSLYSSDMQFDGPRGDVFGLVVRAQDNRNFHAFVVGSDERYGAFHIQNGRLVWDTEWTAANSGIINQDWSENRLRIYANGPEIRFYVNGNLMVRLTDAQWMSGTAGVLAANAYAEDFETTFSFDNWRVWALPNEKELANEGPIVDGKPQMQAAPLSQPEKVQPPAKPGRSTSPLQRQGDPSPSSPKRGTPRITFVSVR